MAEKGWKKGKFEIYCLAVCYLRQKQTQTAATPQPATPGSARSQLMLPETGRNADDIVLLPVPGPVIPSSGLPSKLSPAYIKCLIVVEQ